MGRAFRRSAAALAATAAAGASLIAGSGPANAAGALTCRNQTVYASKANVGPFYYRIASYSNAGNYSNGKPFLRFGVYLDDLQSNPERTTKGGVWEIHISGDKGYRYATDMRPVRSLKKRYYGTIDFDRGMYKTTNLSGRSFYGRLITGNDEVITTGWLKIGCREQR